MVVRTVKQVACDECEVTDNVARWILTNGKGQRLTLDLCAEHEAPIAELFNRHYKGRGPNRRVYTEAEIRKARRQAVRKKS